MPEEKIAIIPHEAIQTKILVLRDKKVMLDSDLALLYEVEPRVLNQAVKRNIQRFPADFMFQLTKEEVDSLRSQIVTERAAFKISSLCLHRARNFDALKRS